MILVTGATGNVGAELTVQLAAHGHPVRAMTRHPNAAAFAPGVEVTYGDADDPASLDTAFRGADRAFLMTAQAPGLAAHPTQDLQLVNAAVRAGVNHVVKLSVYDGGAADDLLGAWHREAEAAVTGSGIDWTLLRPGRFMSNALRWRPMIGHGETVHIPFAHRPAAPIDPADVAAVASAALTTDSHGGRAHQLSGPQVLTPAEELDILAEALDRRLSLVELSTDAARQGMLAHGMPASAVDAIVARVLSTTDGAEVLPTVTRILGRPPGTFATWARTHAHMFPDSAPR